ncbi:hypothetical protein AB1L42_14515 [Thalassoglobus sp. JC818]
MVWKVKEEKLKTLIPAASDGSVEATGSTVLSKQGFEIALEDSLPD